MPTSMALLAGMGEMDITEYSSANQKHKLDLVAG